MAEGTTEIGLRVRSLPRQRRRAGFDFTREPRLLAREAFPEDSVALAEKLLALFDDPLLECAFVDPDGTMHGKSEEALAELRAFVAAEKAAGDASTANPDTAALIEQLLGSDGETELQPPSGASGNAEGDASASGAPGASGDAPNENGASLTSPGTEPSSAEGSAQSRETADASVADRKADADEGKQPEGTSLPPVAEPDSKNTGGPSAAPAAGKPARKAKPGTEATRKSA
ncbi:MAG: hypothetical protein AB7E24_00280 [Novosphingobium sp.]